MRFLRLLNSSRPMIRHCSSSINTRPFSPVNSTMLPPGTFTGKVALVTGGGTGLGKAMATKLSELGANVYICSRKKEQLEVTANEIESLTGRKVNFSSVDVRDPVLVSQLLDNITSTLGLPDIIINNAAGNFIAPFERLSPNAFRTVIDIVLNGTANVTLETGKRLIKAQKGAVFLAISTTYAQTGSGYVVPSAAAKAGIEAMIKSLAAEWGKYGIRFVGIAPGPIYTKGAFDRLDPTGEFQQNLLKKIPTGRMGEQAELANLATYLVSEYANWMTGSIVRIDGGEVAMNSGEFNFFHAMTADKWDDIEKHVRDSNQRGS